MFEFDALIFHCFEDCDAHITPREVVVCTVCDGVFVPHEVHADKAGNHDENCNSHPEKNGTVECDVACDGVVNDGLALGCDCRRYIQAEHHKSAYDACHKVRNVRRAAEFVVDGPVPNRVGMSVEENSAFHFSRAFFDCGDAVSRLLGEAFVNEFFVKTELNEQNHKTECRQNCAEYRQKEEKNHACKHKRDREINPTEKRVGVFGECFHVRSFASAVFFQVICQCTRTPFSRLPSRDRALACRCRYARFRRT